MFFYSFYQDHNSAVMDEEEELEEVLEEGACPAADSEEEMEMGPEAMQMLMEPGIVLAEGGPLHGEEEEEEESMEEEDEN